MAETTALLEPTAPRIETTNPALIPEAPKRPIGPQETAMAGIAGNREDPDLAFSLLAGERGEKPIISPETRQKNYDTVRSGFLHIDREGRCNPGGACAEAFQELVNLSGDNHAWTKEDMQRQEIIDTTMAYRAFGTLHDRIPLVPEEQAVLQKLLDRQQTINAKNDENVHNEISISNIGEQGVKADTITRNQTELDKLSGALHEGINTEPHHIDPYNIPLEWATPDYMGPGLTGAVIRLYDVDLKQTDKLRATLKVPKDSGYRKSTPTEMALLLQQIEESLEKIKKLNEEKKNEEREKPEAKNNPREAARKAIEAKQQDPENSKHPVALNGQEQAEHAEYLSSLRDPNVVGKEKYGEGLVNKFQKGKNTPSEHEEAQTQAYKDLQQKIDAGLVDPAMIGTEMCLKLGVTPDLEGVPESFDGIAGKVNQEMQVFRENGQLTEEELVTLTKEVADFTDLYGKAYGKEDVAKAYELARDNARKLLYQHMVDKAVFSGSDHGFRHIVNGNIRFADQMVASLREKGVVVSAKDQVILHQVMIDHDLGYTSGAAQVPKGWEASKDHPLVSARYVEDNKGYYVDKFGEEGFEAIHDSVLNHSYPRLEYQSDGEERVHEGLIRGISSTVDSLGVTVETKTPEFFWNKDAMRTLLKIRLAQETMGGKVPDELMSRYKQELIGVAQQEQNLDRRAGYENSVRNFFDEFTAENTLGHYTGVVRKVEVEEVEGAGEEEAHGEHGHEGEDKRFRVLVEMTPTEVYAMLGNMFGDKLANQSFDKAIKGLGLDPSRLEEHARSIRGAKSRGETAEAFEAVSNEARIVVGNEFLEDQTLNQKLDILDAKKIQAITEVFHEVELLSIRTNINELLDQITERGTTALPEIQAQFEQLISTKTTANELRELNELFINLSDSSLTGEKDAEGSDITVSKAATKSLRGFVTQREKEFLGV